MSDGVLFAAGCLISLLVVAFAVVSVFELRRLGQRADEKRRDLSEFH